jgi:Acetyltransferases
MITATYNDKPIVIDILAQSFDTNKSVNYVIKQDSKRIERIKLLMEYSFELCFRYGSVLLSPEKNACALTMFPDKKRSSFRTVLWDAKLVLFAIGLFNLIKVIEREARIKKMHPGEPFTYLWFVGVLPAHQGKGIGSSLLRELIKDSNSQNRRVYLETSTERNIPWYQRMGFEIYDELMLNYKLFFLRK